MNYICNNCKYEFDFKIEPHPHPINSFISVGAYGCPICLKAMTRKKVCPKCGSTDLKEFINKEGVNNDKN